LFSALYPSVLKGQYDLAVVSFEEKMFMGDCSSGDFLIDRNIKKKSFLLSIELYPQSSKISSGTDIECYFDYAVSIPSSYRIKSIDFPLRLDVKLSGGGSANILISHQAKGSESMIFSRRFTDLTDMSKKTLIRTNLGTIQKGQMNPSYYQCGAYISLSAAFQIQTFSSSKAENDATEVQLLNNHGNPGLILANFTLEPCW
jgi:hypothetical protein